jgi:anti-sigma factor RsiW
MRCFSCEPLLDDYLEGSLGARQLFQVARHLRGCVDCAALLRELRVIDGLLTTASPPGSVAPDFTATVVSAARVTPVYGHRRVPVWTALIAYLVLAWALAAFVTLRAGGTIASLGAFLAPQERSLAAVVAAMRALAPATPLAAAAVTGILLVDLFLLAALYFGYRRVRPLVALYLTRGSRS